MIDDRAIIVVAQATALPGNEVALRDAIDQVIPPALAEAGVSIFDCTRISSIRDISFFMNALRTRLRSIHTSLHLISRKLLMPWAHSSAAARQTS